jgi:hypothetical protein
MEDFGCVFEHGRASFPGPQAAMVDLSDVGDEVGFDPSRLRKEIRQTTE